MPDVDLLIIGAGPGGSAAAITAARAGLQPFRRGRNGEIVSGDVITAVDGEAVTNLDDMLTLLEKRAPGDRVTLTLWRDGATRRQAVVLAPGD